MLAQASPDSCPALVLNADFRPLSYYPLSLWSWQESIKAVFLDRVTIISEYDRVVRSPRFEMRLPSVIALKDFIPTARRPAFTRFNVFLRDSFTCQYCGRKFATHDLTFDHVIPRSRGGRTTWENVVTACSGCNLLRPTSCRRKTACARSRKRSSRRRSCCRRMAGRFLPATCIRAGATSFTGTASSSRLEGRPTRLRS